MLFRSPSGDETIYNMGPVYPHPGGSTPGPRVSRVFRKEEESEEGEDTSEEDDYNHNQNPFPVPTVGCPAPQDKGADRGRTTTHQEPSARAGRATFPTPPGFVLNVHPNYIPFKLIDDKTGRQIPTKYVQLFLNNDDPYAYGKMSSTGPTFIAKIQAAPDTDTWEKCHGSCPTPVCLDLRHDSLYLMTPRLTSDDSSHVRYLLVVADCLPIPSTAIPSCG